MAQPLEPSGSYWSGLLCLVVAVLNLTPEAHWSWWRVWLPVWAVLGHNILYITVRFVGLSFADHGAPEDESQSAEGMLGTVTNWWRWCALSSSQTTC